MLLFQTNTLAFYIHALIGASIALTGEAQAASPVMLEQPHAVYHQVKGQTLKSAAESIASRTGIVFKLHPSIENDRIEKKLAADNWHLAIEQLLDGYNHVIQSKDSQIALVTVTGRNHNGQNAMTAAVSDKDLMVIEPKVSVLPAKYRDFEKGSVQAITIPSELMKTKIGEAFTVDLPNGRYTVTHDDQIKHGDSQTWIGHLDEGVGYRLSLSKGKAGTMGAVFTPDGEYIIETTDGQTVWIDVNRSGLKDGGFDGDTVTITPATGRNSSSILANAATAEPVARHEPSPIIANTILSPEDTAKLTDLKIKAKSAQEHVDQLNQKVTELTGSIAAYQQSLKIQPATLKAANKDLIAIKLSLKKAKSALKAAPTDPALQGRVDELKLSVTAATKKRLEVLNSPAVFKSKIKALKSELNYTKKLLSQAQHDAETADSAYNLHLYLGGGKSDDFNPDTTIDLMVVYTIQGQTRDYAKQRIQYLVDLSNQANHDSGVNMQYRLVHTESIDYPEKEGNAVALYDITAEGNATAIALESLRNRYGADAVVLFRPLHHLSQGNCGVANLGGLDHDVTADILDGYANDNYAVVSDGMSKDGRYNCVIGSFAHELGHLLGNMHEVEYSGGSQGLYPYSYAWGVQYKFGTIMGYTTPKLMLFSTPNLATECKGEPCGYPEGHVHASDQVRTINATAPYMAKYKESLTITPSIE